MIAMNGSISTFLNNFFLQYFTQIKFFNLDLKKILFFNFRKIVDKMRKEIVDASSMELEDAKEYEFI